MSYYIPLKYEFIRDALEELEIENFFDNWDVYENVDDEKTVSVRRQQTDIEDEKRGVILIEKLGRLKTKKAVKEEIHYLLDGYMPELDEHPVGKKLNKLYKLIDETSTTSYELNEYHKGFVDKMRHWIRHQLNFKKYTIEEIQNSKILDYPVTKDNLKICNEIYKEYNKEKLIHEKGKVVESKDNVDQWLDAKEKLIREKCKEFESHF